ncbi:MAG TPA: amino acid dehydrogenase [Pyrinomonadaceae bacterium]|jgi:leucine dehydrogenase
MEIINHKSGTDHERVVFGREEASGYRGIIAIHSTRLGAALGGARFWNYASEADALVDVLRLARGMTYKNALAGLPFGGGKSIIIGDNRTTEREELFRAHGRFVETLGGSYLTAEDVGTTTADMEFVSRETRHVAGLAHRSGDPSPVTARGVFRAMQAAARHRWGTDELAGRRVALQGCGHVGYFLAKELHEAGVELIVTDVERERVERVSRECLAESVRPEEIYAVEADIFAPCALGGILNDETISQLRVEIVAGAANNQLLDDRHGESLAARGILYAPDYAANAGGVINGCIELLDWEQSRARAKVEAIYDTLLEIFQRAETDGIPTYKAADQLAEARLEHAHA